MAGNVAELVVDSVRSRAVIVAGDSYRDAWPVRIDWRNLDPLCVGKTNMVAAPWVGFRCVLKLGTVATSGE
jgi:hypothetical protein